MTTGPAPAAVAGAGPVPQRSRRRALQHAREDATWPVLVVCLACGFTTLLDSAVLNIAVPSLRASLHASTAASQWILASYSLTFGLALVPAGRLGDLFGRRRLLLAGTAVFGAMSLLSGLATAPWMVIVARLAQGAGAGTISSQVLGLIQDTFHDTRRARALGYYSVVTSVSGVIGPLFSGAAVAVVGDTHGWRVALLASSPLALATFVYGARRLPRAAPRPAGDGRPPLDVIGLALLAVTTVLLALPWIGEHDVDASTWRYLGAASVVLGAFVAWERHSDRTGRASLLPAALRRARQFSLGTATAMFWFGAQLGQMTVIGLYLIESLGLAPLTAAAISLGGSVAMGATAARSWRFLARFGRAGLTRCLLVQAAAMALVGAAAGQADGTALIPVLIGFQIVAGVTNGCFEAPNRTLTLARTPAGSNGVAAGVLQLSQRLAATICIAAVTARSFGGDGAGSPLPYGLGVCAVLVLAAATCSALANRSTPAVPIA